MGETRLTNAPRSQLGIFIAGVVVLAVAVGGALYFLLQVELPTVLAAVVGLFIVAIAVGRFYLVSKHQLFAENSR